MITFANELSKYIKSHSIVSLAKETGINRTLLHKIITGDRNPSRQDDVIAISNALMLSPAARSALLIAYKIDKIGLGTYNRRNLIKQFFELPPPHPVIISPLFSNNYKTDYSSYNISSVHPDSLSVSHHSGIEEIKKITKEVLEHCPKGSKKPIYVILPAMNSDFIETLKFIFFSFPNLNVKHLVCMQQEVSRDSDNHYNLSCFKQIFPLLFYGCAYEAYIYYGLPEVMNSLIMPNYLITAESVISYSSDYSSALHFFRNTKSKVHSKNTNDIITSYRREFLKILRVSSPLFQPLCKNIIDYLNVTTLSNSDNTNIFNISASPCLGYFLTPKLAEKYVKPEYIDKKRLIISLEERNAILKTKPFHATTFFTKEGLQHFVETGLLSDCPEELYEKPSKQDRLSILISAYKAIKAGNIVPYLIDTTKFHLSPLLKAGIYSNKIDQLFLILDLPKKSFQQFYLMESSISNSFIDFIKHLPESDYVLSTELAHKCFQDAIQQLKEM